MQRYLALLAPILILAESAAAQQLERLKVGARVRVTLSDARSRVTGEVAGRDSSALTLIRNEGEPLRIDTREITALDVLMRERSGSEAALRGAKIGFLTGMVVGLPATLTMMVYERRNPCRDCMISGTVLVGSLSALFTIGTTIVGALFGSGDREVWDREYTR